jgi:cold shock CspA family protein
MKISEQPTERGKVVLARFDDSGGYGFIRRDGGGSDVWFGLLATQARILKIGDSVDFVLCRNRSEKGDRAFRVWLRGMETEEGENIVDQS